MHFKVLGICIVSFFTLSGNAQFIKLGVKAGANMVKVEGKSFLENYQLGYHAGLFSEIKIAGNWFFQPEVLFSETHLETSEDFKDIYGNILDISKLSNLKLQQINIPLLINYKLANVLSLSAGPQFSVMMDAGKGVFRNGEKAFKEGDLSWVGGIGLQLGKCRIHGRYILGSNNINSLGAEDTWTHQSAQLSFGFVF